MPQFDITEFRFHFPSLDSGIAHFDGPGGTQTPRPVAQKLADTLMGPLSNRGRAVISEANAEAAIGHYRQTYAEFLNADPRGIVYGRSATQINYDISRSLAKQWTSNDEIVVTRLDHDSNVRPWIQAAERAGATVRWLDFDPATSELILDDLDEIVNERTVIVAVTAASNLIGTKPPVRRIADRAHAVGALVYVDGVHYSAHHLVDTQALGADFFVCSPYKLLGPHCATLAASPELLEAISPDKLLPSTNVVPERFEFGTLPYEIMAGAAAAIEFLASFGGDDHSLRERLAQAYEAVHHHETVLQQRFESGIRAFGDRLTTYSHADDRTSTVFFKLEGVKSWDAYLQLAEQKVLVPAGSFYAFETFTKLDIGDEHGLRIGLAPYNNEEDIDRLLNGLAALIAG